MAGSDRHPPHPACVLQPARASTAPGRVLPPPMLLRTGIGRNGTERRNRQVHIPRKMPDHLLAYIHTGTAREFPQLQVFPICVRAEPDSATPREELAV